jgi:hypothetical protein
VPSPKDPLHVFAKQFYTTATRYIQLEISKIASKDPESALLGDYIEFKDVGKPKTRTRSRPIAEEKMNFGQKFALVQKSADGHFFFTSPLIRYLDDANFGKFLCKK